MQGADQHDAHIAEQGRAISQLSRPGRFALRQPFPHFHGMLRRNAARNQKERYLAWHEIPWTRNDDRVPIVIENVDKMFLKLSDLTAPVKSDKRRFVKTNPAARRQHLLIPGIVSTG
jgi:hypothetical protein